jgi:hypothetical protein
MCEIKLQFKDKAEKDKFMVGLSDGFGENYCTLTWPHEAGIKFKDCDTFQVENIEDEE